MPAAPTIQKISTTPGSDVRMLEIQYNNLLKSYDALRQALAGGDYLLSFYGVGANSTAAPMARGSTDTQVGLAAMTGVIGGVTFLKAASAAGTTFGALGTIPTATWGAISLDVVAAGTVTFRSAAANYTTGYATEALAIAALPARITVKMHIGYITILAASPGWAAATDALAGGSSGAPATTTNYYPEVGIAGATGTATNGNGVVSAYVAASGSPWTGGRNGVLIPTVISRGTTVTLATSAFTFNANGLNNVPKAATTATAIGALGTIPADQWGVVACLIDGAGALTFMSGPSNYTTGYPSDGAARDAMASIFPAANLCMYGYFTVKTKAATAFIFATDSLAGGATGNVASVTNYYPTPGITLASGVTAALLANRSGTVLTSVNY